MFDFIISRKSQEKKCVFWWEPKDGSFNAGDHLSKEGANKFLI